MLINKKKPWCQHPRNRRSKRLVSGIVASILTLQGIMALVPSQVYAETADLSLRNWHASSHISVPTIKPSWTMQVDNYLDMYDTYEGHHAIAEEGKIFTFADQQLIAIDARTGKRLWSYGKDLQPYVTYGNGVVYGLSADHMPFALHAKTGKLQWKSGTSTFIDTRLRTEVMIPTSDMLYAINGSVTFAFDRATGKLRWEANEPLADGHGTAYLEEADGVILRTFMVQGALSSVQLNAYDKKTGKKLWGHFGQGEALTIKNGLVYSIDYYSPQLLDYQSVPDRKVIVNAYNLKSGIQKGSREFTWKLEHEPPYEYGRGGVFLSGGKLYIEQGNQVAEYPFDDYKTGEAPLRALSSPYGEEWILLGVVQDRLMYRDYKTGEMKGVKLANGQPVVLSGDAPISQIDVYDKGMYRAQRNGTLLGINILTAKPVFRVTTGADLHESTLKTGDMVIIQAEGKLLGIKIPASLR